MRELPKEERYKIIPLCEEKGDVVLRSCIEGNIGKVLVDNRTPPLWAVAVAADFCYFLGSADEAEESAKKEVLANGEGRVIVADSPSWIELIRNSYPNTFTQFSRFRLKLVPTELKRARLQNHLTAVEAQYQIHSLNQEIYEKALQDGFTADFCSFFSSMEDCLENGVGYFVIDGGEIASGASSYTYCTGNIEITVGTRTEYRRKGLARACASKLILECLDRGIYPNWEAANLESVALAEQLGYEFEEEVTVYSV